MIARRKFLKSSLLWLPSIAVAQDVVPLRHKKAGNGLLNGLVHFYQFQETGAPFADSGSDPIALSWTNAGAGFARTTGHINAFAGSYSGTLNNAASTNAGAAFDFSGDGTGNISMTWGHWIKMTGVVGSQPATGTFMSVWTPVYVFEWLNTNNFQAQMQDSGGSTWSLSSPFTYDNNWHLLVCGFDKANSLLFFSVDGGAKITQAGIGQVKSVNSTAYNIGNCAVCGGNCPNFAFSDCGTWLNRALTSADISNWWNGGAGIPFSKFTA